MLGDEDVDAVFIALAVEGADTGYRVDGIDQPFHSLPAIEFVGLQVFLGCVFLLFGVGLDVDSEELFISLIVLYLAVDDCLVARVLLCGADAVVIIENEEDIAFEVDSHRIVLR